MFKEIKLPRSGEIATIEILDLKDLDQVLALQEKTRAALPDDQKMFVLPQPESYFHNLLEHIGGLMVGIRSGGKLISQMVVMGPMTVDDMIDQNKLTRNDVSLHHAAPNDYAVIAKSMAVDPDFRGNELSQQMLEAAITVPIARRADHMFAQVSVENTLSWQLFLREGFGIVAAALDPQDNKPRFVLQRPALGFATHHTQTASEIDPSSDFSSIMRLTQLEALIGKFDPFDGAKLAFFASAEKAATWHDENVLDAAG